MQGNYPAGGGYSPLGIYGDRACRCIGPLSSFRTTTAPVLTYVRGYDGVVRPAEAITTPIPTCRYLAPVAYPTSCESLLCARVRDNPAEESAIDWLDHN